MSDNLTIIYVAMIIMLIMAFVLGYLFANIDNEDKKPQTPTVLEKVFTKKEKEQKPESKAPDEENINSFYQ